jgi:hypothetical protein
MQQKARPIVGGLFICPHGYYCSIAFEGRAMGCLLLPLLFVAGVLIGNMFWGNNGALWGAGIGLVLGLVFTAAFIVVLRRGK